MELNEFEKLKSSAEMLYKTLQPVLCPALRAEIYFTSDGFNHLRFDGRRIERPQNAQIRKLRYLKNAVEILKKTTTLQEFRRMIIRVGKQRSDGLFKTTDVEYYAFIAILSVENGLRIRVIVRRMGQGQFHFWSIVPDFQQRNNGAGGTVRIVGSTDLTDV